MVVFTGESLGFGEEEGPDVGAQWLGALADIGVTTVFGVISIVMRAAPLGAFGAMAYTIGKFGTGAILNLLGLMNRVEVWYRPSGPLTPREFGELLGAVFLTGAVNRTAMS